MKVCALSLPGRAQGGWRASAAATRKLRYRPGDVPLDSRRFFSLDRSSEQGIPQLAEALENQADLSHPFIIGELACGQIKMRREILGLLSNLPSSMVATDQEVLALIEFAA